MSLVRHPHQRSPLPSSREPGLVSSDQLNKALYKLTHSPVLDIISSSKSDAKERSREWRWIALPQQVQSVEFFVSTGIYQIQLSEILSLLPHSLILWCGRHFDWALWSQQGLGRNLSNQSQIIIICQLPTWNWRNELCNWVYLNFLNLKIIAQGVASFWKVIQNSRSQSQPWWDDYYDWFKIATFRLLLCIWSTSFLLGSFVAFFTLMFTFFLRHLTQNERTIAPAYSFRSTVVPACKESAFPCNERRLHCIYTRSVYNLSRYLFLRGDGDHSAEQLFGGREQQWRNI